MIGHLGSRVSALLDGQLAPEEAERAWAHVHTCHACRDLVEREGWVKTRLAGLSFGGTPAPDHLKGSLLSGSGVQPPRDVCAPLPHDVRALSPGDVYLAGHHDEHVSRRTASLVAIGGGAVGAAVMGVIALGIAPADAPSIDRRAPVTHLVTPSESVRSPAPSMGPTLTSFAGPARRGHTP
ncbi:anti-sigma factor family protein [Nocardioides sp. MAHUQ-72]|uniref:anti-sigma factor family protein n=1 Tax=unclassified Nocardioides TaxID=2615069 RepID=UPI0036142123